MIRSITAPPDIDLHGRLCARHDDELRRLSMANPLTLKIVSLGLILTCIVVIILFIVFVHTMPGKIARKRNNPQAEAIEILSLLGLLIFPLWMAALVWA
ncbi:MAG: DUF3302 domain-containing protein [Thiohalocapsa sp.]|nr:DUF3302 domain-containing protein [Thiohalocapsa sp.]